MKDNIKLPVLHKDKAYISNNLLLPKSGVSVDAVKSALTFSIGERALYDGDELMGFTGNTFELWDETRHHLIVPREFISYDKYKLYRFPFINIMPTEFEKIRVEDKIELRNETQRNALQSLLFNRSGTLNLACGKGKTIIALKLIAELKVSTIIIVNSSALLDQWEERINTYLDVDSVGKIKGSNYDWKHPIVLAMVQTLSSKHLQLDKEFRRKFGLVIYDEGHHMSAPKFVLSADLFFGRRYSLTATARRTDGLESIYQYHLGQVIYTDLSQALIPDTYFHILDWEIPVIDKWLILDKTGEINTSKIRTYLGTLNWRNEIIYEKIRKDLIDGRRILVLSHSKEHVEKMSKEFGGNSGWTTGSVPREKRISVFKECNPIFATFQLAREWLDIPELNALYITTVFSNSNDLNQAWGRTQRELPDKVNPIVRVIEDTAIKSCVRGCSKLRSYLKILKYPFKKIKEN